MLTLTKRHLRSPLGNMIYQNCLNSREIFVSFLHEKTLPDLSKKVSNVSSRSKLHTSAERFLYRKMKVMAENIVSLSMFFAGLFQNISISLIQFLLKKRVD